MTTSDRDREAFEKHCGHYLWSSNDAARHAWQAALEYERGKIETYRADLLCRGVGRLSCIQIHMALTTMLTSQLGFYVQALIKPLAMNQGILNQQRSGHLQPLAF